MVHDCPTLYQSCSSPCQVKKRPLWRGAFIASIWFAFVLAITLGAQWATLQHYFNQLLTTQDPQALLQQYATYCLVKKISS